MAKDIITTIPQNELIDLHCHILPGIDDGSKSLEISLQLARDAIADGVKYIVATPHHLDRHFTNHATDVLALADWFQEQLNQNKLDLTIYGSQEIHLNGDLDERIDDLLSLDANGKYLLVEFPHEQVPQYSKDLFFRLELMGITPIIAHPERNKQIKEDPNLLYEFVMDGALGQLTATSLTGGFGKDTQKFSEDLIDHGLVHIIASDAHALEGRKLVLKEAYAALNKLLNRLDVDFYLNSKSVVNGEQLFNNFEALDFRKKRWF